MSVCLQSLLLIAVERKSVCLINSCIESARDSVACLSLRQYFQHNNYIKGYHLLHLQQTTDVYLDRSGLVESELSGDMRRPQPHEPFKSLMAAPS